MARRLAAVADPGDDDDLLPGEAVAADNAALARLDTVTAPPNMDAFVVEDEAESIEADEAESGPEREGTLVQEGFGLEGKPAFDVLNVPATLKTAQHAAASNGNNMTLTFECGSEYGMPIMPLVGSVAFEVDFDKLHIGDGATIKGVSTRGGADGVTRTTFSLHFPTSEMTRVRSAWMLVNKYGVLRLQQMQGSLKLPDGKEVDLTARADD